MELWDQAIALHTSKKFPEAEALYDQLLTQNHSNKGLLATLGSLYLETGKYGLAIHLLEASLATGERQSDILCNLGVAYKYAGLMDKSRQMLEEAIKHDPTSSALANYASLFIETENNDKCMAIAKRALDLDPEHAIAHWNLALAQMADGLWDTAWDHHEYGLKNSVMRVNRNLGELPEWDGTKGKKVIVYGEQGLGDEIMFASMIPDMLKDGNTVVFECHKRLKTLFEKSFPEVKCYGTREDEFVMWPFDEKADARISIGSLGKFYRRSQDDFKGEPYLMAESAEKCNKFRVGISWTGGHKAGRIRKRTVPLSWWQSILNVPNVEFVSLQYTDCSEEIDLVNALGYDVKQFPEIKSEDYYETAKLVQSCDLVISVCTSVIHLAGALGVPCWVLTPKNPAWRYQNKGPMPWYRSVRLYRQPDSNVGAWIPVVERIGLDLSDLVNSKNLIQRVA